ncbi:alginate lyase family protein [Paenibacillus gansuensis]|uniref:Alginate lyase family protein n=1 Tax=Paenibacillus gansuensis TaxID=306542 RepID=A0ABW5PHD1_9BACL
MTIPTSVPDYSRIYEFIHRYDPDFVQRTLHAADMALEGKQILSGTRGQWLYVGNPPHWHDNKVNNNGYVWMLNRMNHWLILAEAYLLTGERKYIDQVLVELLDWIESCPPPPLPNNLKPASPGEGPIEPLSANLEPVRKQYTSVNPWRQLEVGERMGNVWPAVLRIMDGIPGMLDAARPKILQSIRDHGLVLREVCPLFWPEANHNYYLTEMWGLFSIGLTFPELAEAKEWGEFARQELERCMFSQFSANGGQLEGCPSYHNYTSVHMGKVGLLARKHGIAMSDAFVERFRGAMEYCVQTCRPTGQIVPWGDSNADHYAAMTTALGSIYLGDPRPAKQLISLMGVDTFRKNIIPLLLDYPEILDLVDIPDTGPTSVGETAPEFSRTFWDREMDQAAMRSDWSKEAFSVFFACRSPIYNGHSHADPAAFDFVALGRPLVIDPGRYNYWWLEERRKFKSAAWHNTLTVNGHEPFEFISSFEYGPQKPGRIEYVIDQEDWLRASAVHHNYEPAVHRRDLVLFPGRCLLVLDEVSGLSAQDTVQLNWHLDTIRSAWDPEQQTVVTVGNEVNVAIRTAGRTVTGAAGEASISDKADHLRPSTRYTMLDGGGGGGVRRYATVIVPFRGELQSEQLEGLKVEDDEGQSVCRFRLNNVSYEVFFNLGETSRTLG